MARQVEIAAPPWGVLVRFAGFAVVAAAILFGSAGRLDLPFFWAYLGILVGSMLAALFFVMDPGLREERIRPGPGGTDRNLRRNMIPLLLASWVIAGLDVGRFHFSDDIPEALQIAALAGVAAAMALVTWAVRVNRFFSPVVRIQRERGHHLVTSGPYRYVRHPGYVASLLLLLGGGLALGSLGGLVPMVASAGLVLRRTVIEDRFLRAELEGYADYARRVRFRLVPGVW